MNGTYIIYTWPWPYPYQLVARSVQGSDELTLFRTSDAFAGFDRGATFAVPVLGSRAGSTVNGDGRHGPNGAPTIKPSETIRQLYDFVQQFRQGESFIYRQVVSFHHLKQGKLLSITFELIMSWCRDRLRANLLAKQYVLEIDLDHLIAFNEELSNRIRETPGEIIPLVRLLE